MTKQERKKKIVTTCKMLSLLRILLLITSGTLLFQHAVNKIYKKKVNNASLFCFVTIIAYYFVTFSFLLLKIEKLMNKKVKGTYNSLSDLLSKKK